MLINGVKLGIENRRINKAFYEWFNLVLKKILKDSRLRFACAGYA